MSEHVFDVARWERMTMFEQMGNIGSEVGRALVAKRQGKSDRMQAALARGLDLIDATVRLWASDKSPRVRELLRARELFAESVLTDQVDATLENYFMQFALAARSNR